VSEGKPVSTSHTVMTLLVFPEHANALGKAFGGQVMSWMDMAGGICSMRHTGGTTVTASVDDLQFDRAMSIGDVVTVSARVNATFRSSLEVEVTVDAESPRTGERWRCVESRMTFVAIDAEGKTRAVTPLAPASDDDHARMQAALARREERLARKRRAVAAAAPVTPHVE